MSPEPDLYVAVQPGLPIPLSLGKLESNIQTLEKQLSDLSRRLFPGSPPLAFEDPIAAATIVELIPPNDPKPIQELRIGVWLRPTFPDDGSAILAAELPTIGPAEDQVRGLAFAGTSMAVGPFKTRIGLDFLRWGMHEIFARMPKRLSATNLKPDPYGSIELTDVDVLLLEPATVRVTVQGSYSVPVVDVPVGFILGDDIAISSHPTLVNPPPGVPAGASLVCTERRWLQVDPVWYKALGSLLSLELASISPLLLIPTLGFALEDYLLAQGVRLLNEIGKSTLNDALQKLPTYVFEPTMNIYLAYGDVSAVPGAFLAVGGAYGFSSIPEALSLATWGGTYGLTSDQGAQAVITFRASYQGMESPVSLQWDPDNALKIGVSDLWNMATVTFDLGDAKAGDTVNRTMRVTATDARSQALHASLTVPIRVFDEPPIHPRPDRVPGFNNEADTP